MTREKFKKLRKIKQRLQSYIEKINTMMKHPKIALDSSMYVNDKKQGEWSQHLRLLIFVPHVKKLC